MQLRLLGPVEVHTAGGGAFTLPRRQERLLLAILMLEVGRRVPAERLCALLWDDDPPARALAALRTYVARIRALLARTGAGEHGVAVLTERGGYRLAAAPAMVDAHLFRELLEQARATQELTERDHLLATALALWRGPALDGAATDRLRQRLCADLDEQHRQAVEESLATGLELGRHRALLPELSRLAADQPLSERLLELHMLALYRDGRTTEALDTYRAGHARLTDQLGLDPGPALQRLHEAILRGDPAPPPPAPARVPAWVSPAHLPADVAGFVGRGSYLDRLDEMLAASITAVVITAIAGTAGIGKTALAVHWSHRVRARFPDGQLYANLRGFDPAATPLDPATVVRRFLDALGVPGDRVPDDPDAQVGLYRSLLSDRRVLVVLDNARTADQVRPLLPATPGCLAVVTSRHRLAGLVAADAARPLALDLLTTSEAVHLLASRLGAARVAAESDAVAELIERCARLPLALAIAAARAATEPDVPLAALAAQLAEVGGALDALATGDAATDIRAVFACSHRALSPGAARLFRLLGLHPGPDVTLPAAASLAGLPPDRVAPLLAEIAQAHLATEHLPGRYVLHDLLRSYATELAGADAPTTRQAAARRLLDHHLHTAYAAEQRMRPERCLELDPPVPGATVGDIPDADAARSWFRTEHRVLLAAIALAGREEFDDHVWQLAWTMVDYLDRGGHWEDGVTTQLAAVEAAGRLGDRPRQALTLRSLALAYMHRGRVHDAHTLLGQAREVAGGGVGLAHVELYAAWAFERQADFGSALHHAEQALCGYRDAGHRHGEATALNAAGWFHARLGRHRQALETCRQALAMFDELDEPTGQAATQDSLGYAHHHLGDHQQAIACYRRSIAIYQTIGERYKTADTLTHLGDTHRVTGNQSAARACWHRALDILTDLDHIDALQVRARLGSPAPEPAARPAEPETPA